MKIKYTIQKHKEMDCYIVWKEAVGKHSLGAKGVFKGTKQQCEEFLKERKED